MSDPSDAALVRAAGTLLGEISNPFSQANIGDDFQTEGPDATTLTMNDIRTMQGEFYSALRDDNASKIAVFATAIKQGLAVIKDAVI